MCLLALLFCRRVLACLLTLGLTILRLIIRDVYFVRCHSCCLLLSLLILIVTGRCRLLEFFNRGSQLLKQFVRHFVFGLNRLINNGLPYLWMVGIHIAIERCFPCGDLIDWDIIKISVGSSINDQDLFLDGHGPVLWLLKDFGQALPAVNTCLSCLVEVR